MALYSSYKSVPYFIALHKLFFLVSNALLKCQTHKLIIILGKIFFAAFDIPLSKSQ